MASEVSELQPGPELDARIAEWMGWEHLDRAPDGFYCLEREARGFDKTGGGWWVTPKGEHRCGLCVGVPQFSEKDDLVGGVLDTLVERGFKPTLEYSRSRKKWKLHLHHIDPDEPGVEETEACWQPTRPLATCEAVVHLFIDEAAVVGLMEEE
jgi:hypothetical protein